MDTSSPRIILVEHEAEKREVLAERLRCQGYDVDTPANGAEAAALALASPPSALVADLWMPGVSGLQICRLLRAEPATEHVPIVLRGASDTPRQRFWAVRAGAAAYVAKGRIGELVRSLETAIDAAPKGDGFFQLHPETADIRDRICQQLDAALYESVVASEVRALSTCETFPRMFDLFSQLLCQITSYRWLAVVANEVQCLGIHARPEAKDCAVAEARDVLGVGSELEVVTVEDEDADVPSEGPFPSPLVRELRFGNLSVGQLAMAPTSTAIETPSLLDLVANELGAPIRIVTLAAKTNILASSDPLTGLLNRRAFEDRVGADVSRAERMGDHLSLLLLDIDHFKSINDTYGHGVGDLALRRLGALLETSTRDYDHVARWGGEEFVVALPQTPLAGAKVTAERIRSAIEALEIRTPDGKSVRITASIGVAARQPREQLDNLVGRADRAMYEGKAGGRNRVVADETTRLARAV